MEEPIKKSLELHDMSRQIGIPDYVLAVYLSEAPIENCEDAYMGIVLDHKQVPVNNFVIFDDSNDVAYEFTDKYAKGGVTPFVKLSNQVAEHYEGKEVPTKYKKIYGERYSKKEAKKVGDKVAAKVYRQQLAKKFSDGGTTPSRNKEIAQTIVNQLGGMNRLVAFTGASNFAAINNGLSFRIKNAKANYIKITLNGKDLYDLEVGRIRGTTYKVVGKENDLYYDMLKREIEKLTGMYLSFGDGGIVQVYGGYPLFLGGMQNSMPLAAGVENIAPMFADGGIVEGVSGYPLRLGGMQVNPLNTVGLVPIFENGGMVEGVSGYPLRLGGMQVNPLTTAGLVPIFEEGGYVSYKDKYNKKYNYKKGTAHSLEEISEDTGVSMKGLQQIYNKGIGAYKTNPASVRPTVKSKEQWAKARVYSAVMGGKAADVDAAELKMSKGGKVQKETYYIEFLNKKKGFQKDVIEFDSYEEAVKWAKDNFERFDYDMIRQRYDTGGTTQTHDSGMYKHWNKYAKTKHKKAYIISNSAAYNKEKYEAIFGDYDEDGIPNADDREPLKPSQERVEGVSFVEQFDNLLEKRNISDEHLERFVDLIDETTPYDCAVYGRTKTPYSIIKSLVDWKIVEDGNNYEAGVKDLLGTTVAFGKISDLEDYRNKVMNGELGEVIDYRDYYENAKDGYRAYHFVVKFDGYPVEVQLKTNRMKELNEISHSLYKNKTLNKDFMLYLTTLANSADNGDRKSKSVYNKLLRNKEELTKKLSK
jgi:ppGpp synthetase/RelA/SpoT-type nucleotidyltranferase